MPRDKPSVRQIYGLLVLADEQVGLRIDGLQLDLLNPDQYDEEVLREVVQDLANLERLHAETQAVLARFQTLCHTCRHVLRGATLVCPHCYQPHCVAHYGPHVETCPGYDTMPPAGPQRPAHPPVTTALGAAIRRRRQAKGWSQRELGAQVGLSANAITRYEQGRYQVRANTLARIAEALDCTMNDLMPPAAARKEDTHATRDAG